MKRTASVVVAIGLIATSCSGTAEDPTTTTTTEISVPTTLPADPPGTTTATAIQATTTTVSEVPVPPELADSAIATSFGAAGPTIALGTDDADGSGCTPGPAAMPTGQWETLPDGVWHVNVVSVLIDGLLVDLGCRYSEAGRGEVTESDVAGGRHILRNERGTLRRLVFGDETTLFWPADFGDDEGTQHSAAELRDEVLRQTAPFIWPRWGWALVEEGTITEFLVTDDQTQQRTDVQIPSNFTGGVDLVNPIIEERRAAGADWQSGTEAEGSGCDPDTTRTLPDGLWYVDVLALRGSSATVQLSCYYGDNPAKRLELGDPECSRDENGEPYCEFDNYAWEHADLPPITVPVAQDSLWVFTWSLVGLGIRAQLTPTDTDLDVILSDHRDTWLTHGFALIEDGVIVAWISNTVQFA